MSATLIEWSYKQGGETVSGSITVPSSGDGNFQTEEIPLTSLQSNQEVTITFPYLKIKSFGVESKTLALTLKTNSTSAPDDTIPVVAGSGYLWIPDLFANPFTANVTKIYVTNGTAAAGVFRIFYKVDVTV